MEDKALEIITKMYNEFSEFRKEMYGFRKEMYGFRDDMYGFRDDMNGFRDETNNRFENLENGIQRVGNQVTRFENDHGKKLDFLLDGYKQLAEGQEGIKDQIESMSSKIDKQEVEITVIKGGKKSIK